MLVIHWGAVSTPDQVRHAANEARGLARAHPSGIGLFSVLPSGTQLTHVGEDVRREAHQFMQLPGVPILGSAVVYESDGFGAALLRGVITSIALVVRNGAPMRIFGSMGEAETWLLATLGAAGQALGRRGDVERIARTLG
ncbi:hypothetical protein [Sandaracinus amylolyticus]|uniref:Uncharacterized protein n=1 Tax=Sandaracinus amylolyticus TaxID=927083 RepID=A0A0F6YIQ8_9BACT|nr:hypothetical protein [Sandaracinus amylolyticus]AKF07266.1 hypothetical protein DB32_004415 [Sandaracinus amylolyticus]